MEITTHQERVLDTTSVVALMTGLGMLLTAFFLPEAAALAVPAAVLALPSLLYATR